MGGSGSRGHGQIQFEALNLIWRPVSFYKTGAGETVIQLPEAQNLDGVIKTFEQIAWPQ